MIFHIPSIFFVAVLNFIAIGIVWTFVARSYSKFPPAATWAVSSFLGAFGGMFWMLREPLNPLLTVVVANGALIAMAWLSWTGVRQFYRRSTVLWMVPAAMAVTLPLLFFFTVIHDSMQARVLIYSTAQAVPVLLTIREIALRPDPHRSHGARLAIGSLIVVVSTYLLRSLGAVLELGGSMSFATLNNYQVVLLVMLMFAVMIGNFAFMLMTIDRLRDDVASLALFDDLTGIANRRHLFQRLEQECAMAWRTQKPFCMLLMDLDEFKVINDSFGHGAGDECLRGFTAAVKQRLRKTDLFARIGGDEFCIILPNTDAEEADVIARQLITTLSEKGIAWGGASITLTSSIGVAQSLIGEVDTPERIMAAADQALYQAKRMGKDRHALHQKSELPAAAADGRVDGNGLVEPQLSQLRRA